MAEENVTPVAGKEPPPANPLAKPRASTLKLKPVIRKPTIGATALGKPGIRPGMKLPTQPPAATSAPAAAPAPEQQGGGAMEQLKSVTQKLRFPSRRFSARPASSPTRISPRRRSRRPSPGRPASPSPTRSALRPCRTRRLRSRRYASSVPIRSRSPRRLLLPQLRLPRRSQLPSSRPSTRPRLHPRRSRSARLSRSRAQARFVLPASSA